MSSTFTIKGNSGCNIDILNGKVIKYTTDKKYNYRLKKQHDKQKSFNNSVFKSPTIYDDGYKDGSYYFLMEFISYKTFDKIFNSADKHTLDFISNKLINFIESNQWECKPIDSSVVLKKFEDTKDKIRASKNIDFSYLNNLFYSLDKKLNIPIGYCHGDLTFSNMLFDKEDVVLLDFLDTFLDSPLQDIVKLKQDTKYFWSLNMITHKFDTIKLKQCLSYIDKIITAKFSKYDYYNNYYEVFQILNLMRIIPYCSNKEHVKFLREGIDKLCQH